MFNDEQEKESALEMVQAAAHLMMEKLHADGVIIIADRPGSTMTAFSVPDKAEGGAALMLAGTKLLAHMMDAFVKDSPESREEVLTETVKMLTALVHDEEYVYFGMVEGSEDDPVH